MKPQVFAHTQRLLITTHIIFMLGKPRGMVKGNSQKMRMTFGDV